MLHYVGWQIRATKGENGKSAGAFPWHRLDRICHSNNPYGKNHYKNVLALIISVSSKGCVWLQLQIYCCYNLNQNKSYFLVSKKTKNKINKNKKLRKNKERKMKNKKKRRLQTFNCVPLKGRSLHIFAYFTYWCTIGRLACGVLAKIFCCKWRSFKSPTCWNYIIVGWFRF